MRKQGAAFMKRDPMAWITRRTPIADVQQRNIGNAYHLSLQAILRGHGNAQAWATLSCSLNIAMMLCEQGFNAGSLETIKHAQIAMLFCKVRAEKFNKYAFTGDEARQVMDACTIHDEQISRATKAQIAEALQTLHQRIESEEVFA